VRYGIDERGTKVPTPFRRRKLSHIYSIQRVSEAYPADHSSPPPAEVKNSCNYIFALQYVLMKWCLIKYREKFISVQKTKLEKHAFFKEINL
jgi:hypothetical protein